MTVLSALAWWWQRAPAGAPQPALASASAAPATAAPNGAAAVGPVVVEVARAEARDVSEDTSAVGSLRSRQGVVIRPEISGRIVKLGFRDGQKVKKGQLLVQLDDALPQAQARQARAQLEIAVTTLKRNQELVAQAFVTQRADRACVGLDEGKVQQFAKAALAAPCAVNALAPLSLSVQGPALLTARV